MKLSETGLDLIKQREQLRLQSYQDGGGVWTIGYGHALGKDPKWRGLAWTQEKAFGQLALDVGAAELVVSRCMIAGSRQTQLDQPEFDALVSMCFNVGGPAFEGSTLVRLWNAGASRRDIAKQMARWNQDDGHYVEGLAMRRGSEIYQFAGGT